MLLSKTPAEYSTNKGKGQWPQKNILKEVLADCSARDLDAEMIERPMRSFASASDLLAKRDGHYTGTSRQSKKSTVHSHINVEHGPGRKTSPLHKHIGRKKE